MGLMCPSTALAETTHVLGIKDAGGTVRFLAAPLPVPKSAVEVFTVDDVHDRLRFTGPCMTRSCAYWESQCTLGTMLASKSSCADPNCSIAESCRWRKENGDRVCGICPSVMWFGEMEEALP